MEISTKLGELTDKMRGLSSRGQSLLKPPVRFGGPCKITPEPAVSWWHVAVFIEPAAIHLKTIEASTVRLVPVDGTSLPIDMRWRTKGSLETHREITLEDGKLYLVPVAARKEAGQRATILTNESFLAKGKAKWLMPPGNWQWRLQVRSQDNSWESAHTYFLKVPPATSNNGHFTLEMRYEGLT